MNNGLLDQGFSSQSVCDLASSPWNPFPFTSYVQPWVDSDAENYIKRVQLADGSTLEPAITQAITQFVVRCKRDGIWGAIKSSCILMGARTLTGALTPLVGVAPTNVNFVSGDYSRKEGLKGNGLNKYFEANRNVNADPVTNQHQAVFFRQPPELALNPTGFLGQVLLGGRSPAGNSTGSRRVGGNVTGRLSATTASGPATDNEALGGFFHLGAYAFAGCARKAPTHWENRGGGISINTPLTAAASAPSVNMTVFGMRDGSAMNSALYSRSPIMYYSIGEYLDLAVLDRHVSRLFSDIRVALP